MSSMRSASSNTRYCKPFSFTYPIFRWAIILPGVQNNDIGAPGKGLLLIGEIAAVPAAIYGDRTDGRKIREPFKILRDLNG